MANPLAIPIAISYADSRMEGSQRTQAQRKTIAVMAEREKRLQADLRSPRRGYAEIQTAKLTWDGQPMSNESRERQLNIYRREMTITAKEILPLQAGIQELGGLAIDTQEVKPDSDSLIVIRGRVALFGKMTKANKTNITIYDFTVPGFSANGWRLTEALAGFQQVLITATSSASAASTNASRGICPIGKLTPNGCFVRRFAFWMSVCNASGVEKQTHPIWPSPPALDTVAASTA